LPTAAWGTRIHTATPLGKRRRGGSIHRLSRGGLKGGYALAILPFLMQLVQTRIRLDAPFTSAFTACRFTFQRRRVTLCACEMLLPNCGPFPQISHTCAMMTSLQLLFLDLVSPRYVYVSGIETPLKTDLSAALANGAHKDTPPPACRIFSIPGTGPRAKPHSRICASECQSDTRKTRCYSYRNATTGSTFIAARAGIRVAASATSASSSATAV